ncbi:uncharacterized protein LOC106881475 isoform X3 [Octopus bimaculoides]|uniref:uncharacterized protein LOC106881475 isoform X3 n=1 Tax=Octopus bimaculoides TaxID=37653 RepID=UPI0022E4025C|nr:uncharacterized protein LOC106881475 isoform X3 [Octopus bimaculoides]
MKYKTRAHAWENFFMRYIKRLLLFPIYHFKQYEMKTFRNAIACFLVTFDDPFAFPEDILEEKKSNRTNKGNRSKRNIPALGKVALKGLREVFAGFLGNIASDGLTGFLGVGDSNKDGGSSTTELPNVNDWEDMKVTKDKITVVLLGDRRFLRSFKFVIEDFQQYKLKCLANNKKMTADEHKFCNIKSQSLNEQNLDSGKTGAIVKISPTFSFTVVVSYTFFLVCTFY